MTLYPLPSPGQWRQALHGHHKSAHILPNLGTRMSTLTYSHAVHASQQTFTIRVPHKPRWLVWTSRTIFMELFDNIRCVWVTFVRLSFPQFQPYTWITWDFLLYIKYPWYSIEKGLKVQTNPTYARCPLSTCSGCLGPELPEWNPLHAGWSQSCQLTSQGSRSCQLHH